MKERPALMNADAVRAVLAGIKTQMRRIMKPQPDCYWDQLQNVCAKEKYHERCVPWWSIGGIKGGRPCPYGKPGDRLWVRETWAVGNIYDRVAPRNICLDIRSQEGRSPTKAPCKVAYPASGGCAGLKGRPSTHMPRWASRLTLEITDVRVERLNDISARDAWDEGCPSEAVDFHEDDMERSYNGSLLWFKDLWESINGPGSWCENPWVWVVEFEKLEEQQ